MLYDDATIKRFWAKVQKTDSCWLWTAQINNKGYGVFRLNNPRRSGFVHRISWELHFGEVLEGMCVCHNCPGGDVPHCVNPAHLFLGTHQQNMADMGRKGRTNTTKLTPEIVAELRARKKWVYGERIAVCTKYDIDRHTLYRLLHHTTWKECNLPLISK